MWRDVIAAASRLRARGAESIMLVGASMGGTASLIAASRTDVNGIVTLSAPTTFMGLAAPPEVLAAIDEPKLFLAAEGDGSASESDMALYEGSSGAKRVGVGTARLPMVVEAGDAFLVGPDNGVLSLAWDELGGASRAFTIATDEITLSPMSRTFHGRDVFAPAAAYLAGGGRPEGLGRALDPAELIRITAPVPDVKQRSVECRIIAVDRFGNVQLSAREDDLGVAGAASVCPPPPPGRPRGL